MDKFNTSAEITEDEIKVEEIMEKIRENIRKRKGAGNLAENNTGVFQQGFLPDSSLNGSNVQRDLEYINSNWDIQNNSYFISSHRPVVGKVLVGGRELVHGEVRRYVDPIVWKQKEFNGSTTRLFNDVAGKFGYYNDKIEQLRSEMDSRIEQLKPEFEDEIEQLKSELDNKIKQLKSEIDTSIKAEVSSIISSMNLDIENKAWLAHILDSRIEEGYIKGNIKEEGYNKGHINKEIDIPKEFNTPDSSGLEINYFRFEEQFRGSREDIKHRQSNFMNYFLGCSNVLDIGCGRGEFLELSKEHGIAARGIDIDDTMVDYCLSKGLSAEKEDALSYLEKLDDRSLDGVFIDQVVEHLEPDYLIKLLKLCFQKLKYGYYIFVETVNPLSLVSFANFYIDMTHKKPIHPETLKFLLTSSGFRDVDAKFFSPVSEEARLQKVSLDDHMEKWLVQYLDIYNHNIDKLNGILYGAQDYAVIGKK